MNTVGIVLRGREQRGAQASAAHPLEFELKTPPSRLRIKQQASWATRADATANAVVTLLQCRSSHVLQRLVTRAATPPPASPGRLHTRPAVMRRRRPVAASGRGVGLGAGRGDGLEAVVLGAEELKGSVEGRALLGDPGGAGGLRQQRARVPGVCRIREIARRGRLASAPDLWSAGTEA